MGLKPRKSVISSLCRFKTFKIYDQNFFIILVFSSRWGEEGGKGGQGKWVVCTMVVPKTPSSHSDHAQDKEYSTRQEDHGDQTPRGVHQINPQHPCGTMCKQDATKVESASDRPPSRWRPCDTNTLTVLQWRSRRPACANRSMRRQSPCVCGARECVYVRARAWTCMRMHGSQSFTYHRDPHTHRRHALPGR